MKIQDNHKYYDSFTVIGYEATLRLLRKINTSRPLVELQSNRIDKAIEHFKKLPEKWPLDYDFQLNAVHNQGQGKVAFEFYLSSDRLSISLGSSEELDAGIESFTDFEFVYEKGDIVVEQEGDISRYDAFADEIDSDYFGKIQIEGSD